MKKIITIVICLLIGVNMISCSEDKSNVGYPFNEPLEEAYNYCPSIIEEEDGTRYVYYCANDSSGVVQDFICCRKGTLTKNGEYKWTDKKVMIGPRYGYYDGFHCCDPSVIKGEFSYKGEMYSYLMAYTGNTSAINNKVGLAISKSPYEGWIQMDSPLVTYSGDKSHWGVGQPCLLSIDEKSSVLLFYSVGGTSTCTMVEKWDFSNMESPQQITSNKLTENGLKSLTGGIDCINNIDVAYDPIEKRYYFVSDCHPYPTDGEPSFVSDSFRITYLSEKNSIGNTFLSQENQSGKLWMTLKTVGESETGFKRNSNCGIVRDAYGRLRDSNNIEVLYSMSNVGNNYMWSYRIYSIKYSIEE